MTNNTEAKILGVQQIAVGAEEMSSLLTLFQEIFGLRRVSDFSSGFDNVREVILQLGIVSVHVMEPIDRDSKPKVHKPALNHIGLWVNSLEAWVAKLQSHGVEVVGHIRPGAEGYPICFIHPTRGGRGILIELVEAPEEVQRKLEEISAVWDTLRMSLHSRS